MSVPNTYTDNVATTAPISNVGFKISKPGYDANRTAGNNYIFNSSWPSLPIAFEQAMTNPITSSSSSFSVPHNLNFPAFTIGWYYGPDESGIGNTSRRFVPRVDNNTIYMSGNDISFPAYTATKIILRCFQLDLSQDIDYALAPGDTFNMPYDNNFGVKYVKQGKDINSKDMRDFVMHSRCQSPLILAVKTEKTISPNTIYNGPSDPNHPVTVVQYTNKTKNPTWNYGFVKNASGVYRPAPLYTQSYPRTFTDGFITYTEYNSPDLGATVVVLRDPMFAPNSVTVQY